MIYLVKAFDHDSQVQVKKLEVTGILAAQALEAKWHAQGYDVTLTMECLKYIEIMKIKGATVDLSRERTQHSDDIKTKAARMVLEAGMTRQAVADILGVNFRLVSKWTLLYAAAK